MAKKILGKVAISPRGEYAESVTYYRLDLVSYNGSSYLSKIDNNTSLPTMAENWMLVAQKGDEGKALEFADLTVAQKAELKGEKGDTLTYENLTEEQKKDLSSKSLKIPQVEIGKTDVSDEKSKVIIGSNIPGNVVSAGVESDNIIYIGSDMSKDMAKRNQNTKVGGFTNSVAIGYRSRYVNIGEEAESTRIGGDNIIMILSEETEIIENSKAVMIDKYGKLYKAEISKSESGYSEWVYIAMGIDLEDYVGEVYFDNYSDIGPSSFVYLYNNHSLSIKGFYKGVPLDEIYEVVVDMRYPLRLLLRVRPPFTFPKTLNFSDNNVTLTHIPNDVYLLSMISK